MKRVRIHSSKGASLPLLWPAALGGGALLWLLPVACSLNTEGQNYDNAGSSGSPVTSSNGASSSASASVGAGGTGGDASSSGAGMGGAGGGTGGGAPVVFEWQAVNPGEPVVPCTDTYTYMLPSWLKFSSPTEGERTSQVAEDRLCRGYTKDVPRARNVGNGWGLSVEREGTNLVRNSARWALDVGWGDGDMDAQTGMQDPAGGMDATEFASPGGDAGHFSNYSYDNPQLSGQVASSWLRGSSGVAPYAHFRHVIEEGWVDVDSDQWKRYVIVQNSNKTGDMALETRNKPNGAGVIMGPTKVQAFGAQIEASVKYPSSYIPTGSAQVTRLAEVLYSNAPGDLIKGGWLDVEITITPHYRSDQKSEQHEILYFDDQNRLSIDMDEKVEFRIANDLIETKAIPFNAEDEVLIIARSTPTGRLLTVKVNGVEIESKTGRSEAAIQSPVNFYILGDGTGAQESADLRAIKFTQVPSP